MKTKFKKDDCVRHKASKKEMYIAKANLSKDSNTNSTGYYECTWVEFGAERNTFEVFHEDDLEALQKGTLKKIVESIYFL